MRFFDKTAEIASLREKSGWAKENAPFTVVTGVFRGYALAYKGLSMDDML